MFVLKDKLLLMSEVDVFVLFVMNGNFVKCLFLFGLKMGLVGFDEVVWVE